MAKWQILPKDFDYSAFRIEPAPLPPEKQALVDAIGRSPRFTNWALALDQRAWRRSRKAAR